ncbi:MAG: DUF4838 domain-containing protein [Clostridia bacterium]|nr:DUF4838 domain-containing protein [Clostridia bacterium]
MKKKFRFLAMALLSVTFLASCGGKGASSNAGNSDNNSTNSSGGDYTPDDYDGQYKTYDPSFGKVQGTIHERSMQATTEMFFANGASEYKILIASDAGTQTKKAVGEFNMFFEEATGKRLITTESDSEAYNENVKYVSLGKTSLLETSGLEIDYATIGAQGYEIVTEGSSIFVAGQDKGVLNGVYDLLNCLIGWDAVTANYCYVNENVTEIPLYDFDIKEVPDIEYRIPSYGSVFYNTQAAQRMRLIPDQEIFIRNANTHSAFEIIPPSENMEAHPKWYSDDGEQLCYTAHGDAEEYEKLIEYTVDQCKELIIADPDHRVLSVSQNDMNVWCRCQDGCRPTIEKYGANSATQILFINKVAERVETWLKDAYPERKIMFDILAYHQSEQAPTKQQADGTWATEYEEMKLRDNIEIMVAPIHHDYVSGVFAPNNVNLKNVFESWRPLAKNYSVWSYDCYFLSYLAPMDTWSAMGDFVKYLVSLNTQVLFPQGAWNLRQSSNFDELKMYIYSKIQWNANLDMKELINSYFDKLYREASDTMKQAYWNMRTELHRHTLMGRAGTIQAETVSQKYYSKRYLLNQIAQIEKAYADIEKYKTTDPEYYAMAYNSIMAETIGPRWLLLELYEGTFSNMELETFLDSFAADARSTSVDRLGEPGSMETYLAGYGR